MKQTPTKNTIYERQVMRNRMENHVFFSRSRFLSTSLGDALSVPSVSILQAVVIGWAIKHFDSLAFNISPDATRIITRFEQNADHGS